MLIYQLLARNHAGPAMARWRTYDGYTTISSLVMGVTVLLRSAGAKKYISDIHLPSLFYPFRSDLRDHAAQRHLTDWGQSPGDATHHRERERESIRQTLLAAG